ncbi:MAG: DUF3109 family protein [Bacteroidales bacterium]|nr:DUF3109 family protein [Bacteroidales bacterium]MCM1146903.1 DUF3109 family protein [Bacteroidales bacterium]MCM1205599.1 DUF3109 family protein [Bacillota bacterium]MCM1510290.1 DUF3109 family protein [Clostridium sp.]
MIVEIQGILVSTDILTEEFCCDLEACKGQCCIEGDAGAPVTLDEIARLEDCLDAVWQDLSATAQATIEKQGVAYTDREGDLVTSIVNGKDCVFTYYDDIDVGGRTVSKCCLCATEKAFRAGRTSWCKPVSCALYPIRVKEFGNGAVGLNYHRWNVCKDAVRKGRELHLPLYKFLKDPLIRRFGKEWYEELCAVADELKAQGFASR